MSPLSLPLLFLQLQHAMEDILIFTIPHDDPPSSPPRSLLPLMLTCRRFHDLLHPANNPHLYRRIFYHKFDFAAIARRFPPSCIVIHPKLKKRFLALRCIKRGNIHDPHLEKALLVAYIMILEHDHLNYRYLEDLGLPALLERYIIERLHRGRDVWPTEDTCNVLAVALFWHMTSQDALNGESIESRNRIMDILYPFTFAWFRYSFVEQGFDPYDFLNGSRSKHHPSPPAHPPVHPPPVTVPIDCMGHSFDLRLPAIALSASLAYLARLDAFPLALIPYRPPSRELDELERRTLENVEHYNSSFRTRTVPRDPGSLGSPSTLHDWDWLRAVAGDPFMSEPLRRYTPGILTGKWRGTELAPFETDVSRFMTGDAGPAELPDQSRVPFSCCLEEHVRYSKPQSCASGDEWDDQCHVPLFPPSSLTRTKDGMELFDGRNSTKTVSELGLPSTTRADQDIVDVILSGRTESHILPAWEFSGRVRISDGLVVLVRQSRGVPRRSIFVGYVLSSQNFVGKWKYCSPGAQWEGIWSLCKAD